jgi:transposase
MSHHQSKYEENKNLQLNTLGKYLTMFQHKVLQKSLKGELSDSYRQRIEIMLMADEGKSQTEICRVLGCCPATVRHWMHIARVGMAHQWQECALGRPKAVNEEYLERLQELLSQSPRDCDYPFQRWTVSWLNKQLTKELGVKISDRHLKRLLKEMGLSTVAKVSKERDKNSNSSSKILIGDLEFELSPECSDFLPISFTKNYEFDWRRIC